MNLIRMNLYRFIKTKTVYVILIITALLAGFLIMDQSSEKPQALNQEIMQQQNIDAHDTAGMTIGLKIITSASMMTVEFVGSGMILMFIAIFVSLFSNAERAGGFLKNLNACSKSKEQIFLAKVVPIMIFVFMNLCIIPLVSVASGLQGDDIFSKEFVSYMAIQWLIHTAYGIFILTLMEITRSLVTGILVGIFTGMGVGVLIVQFVENAFHGSGIISEHMLAAMARMIVPDNIVSLMVPALMTGGISLIMYLVIGSLMFKIRDIY